MLSFFVGFRGLCRFDLYLLLDVIDGTIDTNNSKKLIFIKNVNSMYFRLFFLVILIFVFPSVAAQTVATTKQVITYFENGKISAFAGVKIVPF